MCKATNQYKLMHAYVFSEEMLCQNNAQIDESGHKEYEQCENKTKCIK